MDNALSLPARLAVIVLGMSSLLCSSVAMAVLPAIFLAITVLGALAGIVLMVVGFRGLTE